VKCIFHIIFLFSVSISWTQIRFSELEEADFLLDPLDGELFQNDITQIRKTIIAAHPDPFIYRTKGAWDSTYVDLLRYFKKPRTLFDFISKTASWLGELKDSHVGMDLDQILDLYKYDNSWLIFKTARLDEKFYAASEADLQFIPFGNELLEINSMKMDSLFNLAMIFSLEEGASFEARQKYAVTLMGPILNLVNTFDTEGEKVLVKHCNQLGDTLYSFVKTYTSKERKKEEWKTYQKTMDVEFTMDSINRLGVLKINTFLPSSKRAFEQKIDAFFDSVANSNISNVLLDIRWNRGGYFEQVEYLFNYIDTAKNTRTKTYISKRSEHDNFSNLTWLSKLFYVTYFKTQKSTDKARNNYSFFKLPMGALDTIIESNEFDEPIRKNKYRGACFLAMNGVSISASVDFASWFKETKRGLILGEQCMGPLTGTCGNPVLFELKNTRISVATSTMRSYTHPGLQVASDPIYPDVPIKYSITDFRTKKDPIVEYIKTLK
jgi:hypothetical protein